MVLPDLISSVTAAFNPQLAALANTAPGRLAQLITAASDTVRRHCQRDFTNGGAVYSEYYSGEIYKQSPMRLRQFPVTRVVRVATQPTPAILVTNSAATAQRATIETAADSSTVTLTYVESGVAGTAVLSTATYLTLGSLATAINAAGHGFTATVQTASTIDLALYPSADLKPLQGATTTIGGGACLSCYLESIGAWGDCGGFNGASDGWTDDDGAGSGYGWRLDPGPGELYGVFPRGHQNIRIDYTAGFSPVPQAVQEATVQTAVWLLNSGNLNAAVESERLGPFGKTVAKRVGLPPSAISLLFAYAAPDRLLSR